MKLILSCFSLFFVVTSSISFGVEGRLLQVCKQVDGWVPGQEGPQLQDFSDQFGFVDGGFVGKNLHRSDFLLVDARGDKERSQGLFQEALSLRAGLKLEDPNDFKKDIILEKARAHLKRPELNFDQLKKYSFMIFCNGKKCPKSAKGACALRELGVPAKNVFVVYDSYEQLFSKGLSLYFDKSRKIGSSSGAKNSLQSYFLRLTPGMDLRLSLETFAKVQELSAGSVVSVAGSLKKAKIRFADQKEPSEVEGPLEIVSLGGTLSQLGPHLHISVADKTGKTLGGHLAEGSLVYTTAEITILNSPEIKFSRSRDEQTTFDELVIEKNKK